MELDHIFICTRKGAPEAELLRAFGLTEGSRNCHQGQGTANRRFFFHNAMLELLWLHDPDEATSDVTRPTGLFERCSLSDGLVSPFGFCFRPNEAGETSAPFPAWEYKPVFFPHPWSVEVGNAPLSEPMWFFLAFLSRANPQTLRDREPLDHAAGLRDVSAVTVHITGVQALSAPAISANGIPNFTVVRSDSHLVELAFDGETRGLSHDFRPALPLVFRW